MTGYNHNLNNSCYISVAHSRQSQIDAISIGVQQNARQLRPHIPRGKITRIGIHPEKLQNLGHVGNTAYNWQEHQRYQQDCFVQADATFFEVAPAERLRYKCL